MTLKTIIHGYRYDVSDPEQAAEYCSLCLKLADRQARWMHALAGYIPGKEKKWGPSEPVEVETAFLFSNQWNTADVGDEKGHRVFDWYEGIYPNADIKSGHWLEITPEMDELRRNTYVCGYCGAQEPAAKDNVFCASCLDSPYLKEKDLRLLRMQSAGEYRKKYPELTAGELAHLMPQYVLRQTTGADSRNVARLGKQRANIISKRDTALETANAEHEGMLWLMDHDVSVDNVLYYTHTKTFCFGWRDDGLSAAVAYALAPKLEGFPLKYEIKRTGE